MTQQIARKMLSSLEATTSSTKAPPIQSAMSVIVQQVYHWLKSHSFLSKDSSRKKFYLDAATSNNLE